MKSNTSIELPRLFSDINRIDSFNVVQNLDENDEIFYTIWGFKIINFIRTYKKVYYEIKELYDYSTSDIPPQIKSLLIQKSQLLDKSLNDIINEFPINNSISSERDSETGLINIYTGDDIEMSAMHQDIHHAFEIYKKILNYGRLLSTTKSSNNDLIIFKRESSSKITRGNKTKDSCKEIADMLNTNLFTQNVKENDILKMLKGEKLTTRIKWIHEHQYSLTYFLYLLEKNQRVKNYKINSTNYFMDLNDQDINHSAKSKDQLKKAISIETSLILENIAGKINSLFEL